MGYDSLSHNEVIKMGSEFIAEETMQQILIGKYPILLIDESQDTKKELIDALLNVYVKHKTRFTIGMFGDSMQRIYNDGKDNLHSCIPDDWNKPIKIMNHRSAKRIVQLANSIRNTVDEQQQRPRSDAKEGTVRLFIADTSSDKGKTEQLAAQIMSKKANDDSWLDSHNYKSLILEHHMAASRLAFSNLYNPLNESSAFDTSLRDGSISELSFLSNVISPLVKAHHENDNYKISKIIRQHSPLLNKIALQENTKAQIELLQVAEDAVNKLLLLWENQQVPTCIEILGAIKESNLFTLNSRVDDILSVAISDENPKITALRTALSVSFDELERYFTYVSGNSHFATHQGVKGLEFPRVMVIMDDSETKGFMFSYEKLFGARPKTDTDRKNEREGKDTSIMRTTRLFYVACTRAEDSLAIVAYTEDKETVMNTAISNGWFLENEIEILGSDTSIVI
jgi:DNA helicase-2/ATP-dependent DNA helicase PcrA